MHTHSINKPMSDVINQFDSTTFFHCDLIFMTITVKKKSFILLCG